MLRLWICLTLQLLHCINASTPDNNWEDGEEMHLYGGDIVLSPAQRRIFGVEESSARAVRLPRAVVMIASEKWLDGVVPYQFSTALNNSAKRSIEAAMNQIIQDTTNCVFFRSKQPHDLDYLHFFPGNGCYSHIGRQGGRQNISIGHFCEAKGIIMHEIIHALGRWHEQSRPDRDDYVTINEKNIENGFQNNFEIIEDGKTSTQGMPYDFDSIMHYDAYAFSANEEPTILPVDSNVVLSRLGQRERLSEIDKQHIRNLYNCDRRSQWSVWTSWSDCSVSCGSGTQQRTRTCIGLEPCRRGSSSEQRTCNSGDCPTAKTSQWGHWSPWSGCSQSCGRGQRSRLRECPRGRTCEGGKIEMQECTLRKCPKAAKLTQWSEWTECSGGSNCEDGHRNRTRKCIIAGRTAGSYLCSGPAIEVRPCFTNSSCDAVCSSRSCEGSGDYLTGERKMKRCCNRPCYNNTCLSGLELIGCYHFSASLESMATIEWGGVSDKTTIRRAIALRTCGKAAQLEGHNYFGLEGKECYSGTGNVTEFIQSGSSRSCEGGGGIFVYRIVDKEGFQHSVGMSEKCGLNFCQQTYSSASTVLFTRLIFFISLWSLHFSYF